MLHPTQVPTLLKTGGIIAYPTESMYGLGCDPYNEQAVHTILRLKKRSIDMGLILVVGSFEQAIEWIAHPEDLNLSIVQKHWPGPVSFLFEKSLQCPYWISGKHSTIALRFSKHPVIQALTSCYGKAIVSTSANIHKTPEARDCATVNSYFPDIIIVEGSIGITKTASSIYNAKTGEKLR